MSSSPSEHSVKTTSRWHVLWILPPIIIGVAVMVIAKNSRQTPAASEYTEPTRAVRFINAQEISLIPTAQGYGAVEPERRWSALAQVSGRIVETHPRLHNGENIPAGEVLLRIDPVDYELALAQTQAELTQLDREADNAAASLKIEKRNHNIALREMNRLKKLAKQGTASRSDADNAERTMLNTRTAVQNLENTLALIPSKRAVNEARIIQAERDLAHTTIIAPLNMRIDKLGVEKDQFATQNQVLFIGESIDRIEITAQVSISAIRNLFIGRKLTVTNMSTINRELQKNVGFHPVIELDLGDATAQWKAEFVRFSGDVDIETRTMGIVVAVDRPFSKVIPGYRPPLNKGMFVKVSLRGNPQDNTLIVPRNAVRGNKVYISDADNRLRHRTVELLYQQDDISVIKKGLQPGEKVVVTDLVPAVEGMLLLPTLDKTLQQRLKNKQAQTPEAEEGEQS